MQPLPLYRFATKFGGTEVLAACVSLGYQPEALCNPVGCETCGKGSVPQGLVLQAQRRVPVGNGEVVVITLYRRPLGRGWYWECLGLQYNNPLCAGEALYLAQVGTENRSPCTCEW